MDYFLDPAFLVAFAVIFFAFLVRGLMGFGGAMIATPILSHFYDLSFFIPAERLFQFALGVILLRALYKQADFKKIGLLFVGFLPGTFLGAQLLKNYPSEQLRPLLAVLIIGFAVFMWRTAEKPVRWKLANYWGPVAGFFGGLFGGLFGIGAPTVLLFLAPQIETKEKLRATMITLFTLTSLYTAVIYYLNGFYTYETLKFTAALSPAFLVGSFLGYRSISRFSEKGFRMSIAGVLVLAGAMLLVRAAL